MASSHYELLGVDQQASPEQVKAAYQKLLLTLHPDKAGEDSQDRFQQLQQAWQVSSHVSSRAGLLQQPGSGGRRKGSLSCACRPCGTPVRGSCMTTSSHKLS